MKVFIGSERSQARAEAALVESIKLTSPTADVVVMRAGDGIWQGFPKTATGFTLFRWCIPHVNQYQGFAIYLDCDMIVLRDLEELYAYRQPGCWVQNGQHQGDCVSVIDCSAMPIGWPSFAEIKGANKNRLRQMLEPITVRSIPDEWNSCDEILPNAGLVHFTSIPVQPWTDGRDDHPCREAVELWDSYGC